MDVSITDLSEVDKEVSILATVQELAPHFDQAYQKHRATIELKGFRKGKAPLDLIKKLYGESIEYDSLNDIANEFYHRAMSERDIHPIGEPVLTDISYKRGQEFSFKVKYQIKPQFELQDYTGIAVERVKHIVTDREVEDECNRIRRANAIMTEAETAENDEYIVTVDIQETDAGGSPIIGKKSADVRVYLADETVYPEIRAALRGATPTSAPRVMVEREKEGTRESTNLQLSVKKIERVELPALNDDLVKKVTKGKITSVDAFMTDLRKDIEHFWEDKSRRRLSDALISEVVRRHDFPVPDSMVKGILDAQLEDVKLRYPGKKLPAGFDEQQFREQNKAYAAFQARWFLIRERIIEKEGMTASDAELEQQAERDAPSMGIDSKRLLDFYKSSDSVRDRIVSEKLLRLLEERAVITERTTEDPIE